MVVMSFGITFSSKKVDPLIPSYCRHLLELPHVVGCPFFVDAVSILLSVVGFTTKEVNRSNTKSNLRFDIS